MCGYTDRDVRMPRQVNAAYSSIQRMESLSLFPPPYSPPFPPPPHRQHAWIWAPGSTDRNVNTWADIEIWAEGIFGTTGNIEISTGEIFSTARNILIQTEKFLVLPGRLETRPGGFQT